MKSSELTDSLPYGTPCWFISPPTAYIAPTSAFSEWIARALYRPFVWEVGPRSKIAIAGRVVPNSRAIVTMSRSLSVVIPAAHLGVRSFSSTFHQSARPSVQRSLNVAGSTSSPALNRF
jgi:hypothetical protein